ncbi:MAG: tetratricopeptide repeat protein [Acidobacteriaceae bacterium]
MAGDSGKLIGVLFLSVALGFSGAGAHAQQSKAGPPRAHLSSQQAITLAEHGHCRQAIAGLKTAMAAQVPAETRKHAGVLGVRCGLAIDDRTATLDFIRGLNKDFARDPDVLFIAVHAYSDLATRTAQDLARFAPHSIAAHKLNAEALEEQGKWQPAELEYEGILKKDPNARGIHFLLGRLLLSRPDGGPDAAEKARQEFLKELQIDPTNVDAHYILGELARRSENWDQAISHFSQAAKLNPNFAEAYLGWGVSLLGDKKYQDAIAPLRHAEELTPRNPDVHNALATALVRTGHKEEAEREFAILHSLSATDHSGAPNSGQQQ